MKEQVTSASRAALVLWVTPYHIALVFRESDRPPGRLGLCQEQAAWPGWPGDLGQQPDTASAGELVEREGHPRDFQLGELQFESNGSLFWVTRHSGFNAGQTPMHPLELFTHFLL